MSNAITPMQDVPGRPPDTRSAVTRLKLYVAQSTPNSIRAEVNLQTALNELGDATGAFELEIVDVFVCPKRAITDGVIVTPTLIGSNGKKQLTMMGDLSDGAKLRLVLRNLHEVDRNPVDDQD